MDIEKAFDFVDHSILLHDVKKMDLGRKFDKKYWMDALLTSQHSCIVNKSLKTSYCSLEVLDNLV